MERTLVHRIHNPRNRHCGCHPDCWCNRTRLGRLVKWWFPARRFGISHRRVPHEGMTEDETRVWKQVRDGD